jgi:hypothetical protein
MRFLILCIISLVFLAGCASKDNLTKSIEDIQEVTQKKKRYDILVTEVREEYFKGYLDDDYALQYLCYKNSENRCNYYDVLKHAYANGSVKEEQFYINEKGYDPIISTMAKDVQCGQGTLLGWIAIFDMEPFGVQNHSANNSRFCYSRFSKIDDTQMSARFIWGMLTFMTPFVIGGTMHTRMFDLDEFKKAIDVSNINTFKDELFKKAKKNRLEGGIDVVYLRKRDVENSLNRYYEKLKKSSYNTSGVIFLEEKTNQLLAMLIFNEYKKEPLHKAIALQVEEILNQVQHNSQQLLMYEDIVSYIPKEVELPSLPKVPKLVKSEYEKEDEFQKRVELAVFKRETTIRNLQRQYSQKVAQRNAYIEQLQQSYENYIHVYYNDKQNWYKQLNKSLPQLTKILFLQNNSGYGAKEFNYDAEKEKLYFTIYSKNQQYHQTVFSKVSPKWAKQIKEEGTFKIIPNINVANNTFALYGFDLYETTSGKTFQTVWSNISFKPQYMSVHVATKKEQLHQEKSKQFKHHQQKPQTIVDSTQKEIWYIQVAKRVNAKVPLWFSHPEISQKARGYGEANSLEEAKMNARKDLAYQVQVDVTALYEKSKIDGVMISHQKTKQYTQQSTKIKLKTDDYTLIKQEQIEGRWYVVLEYNQ